MFKSENLVKLIPQVIILFYTLVPGKPELSVEQDETTVYVSWTLEHKNGIIKNYNVLYIRDDDSTDVMNLTTNRMKQNFEDLSAGKTYEFQVRVSQKRFSQLHHLCPGLKAVAEVWYIFDFCQ